MLTRLLQYIVIQKGYLPGKVKYIYSVTIDRKMGLVTLPGRPPSASGAIAWGTFEVNALIA